VIEEPVNLLDLMPTILEMAGLAVPEGLHGSSLVPLLEGRAEGWRDCTYVETVTFKREVEQRCVRIRDWKLIADAKGEHEFYDLRIDPEEERNIFLTPRLDVFEMFKHMRSFAPEIQVMAQRMREIAASTGDARGIELAGMVEAAIKDRLS
jgi:arylsulfatase A-like enzyme